jgi:hypothetical protein
MFIRFSDSARSLRKVENCPILTLCPIWVMLECMVPLFKKYIASILLRKWMPSGQPSTNAGGLRIDEYTNLIVLHIFQGLSTLVPDSTAVQARRTASALDRKKLLFQYGKFGVFVNAVKPTCLPKC